MTDKEIRAELKFCALWIAGISTSLAEVGVGDDRIWRGLEKCSARLAGLALSLRDVEGHA